MSRKTAEQIRDLTRGPKVAQAFVDVSSSIQSIQGNLLSSTDLVPCREAIESAGPLIGGRVHESVQFDNSPARFR
jgi:hypothetical protein